MANDYTAAYLATLDAVYKKGALTSILDTPESMVRYDERNPKVVYTRNIVFGEGLADYTRSTGYDDTTAEVDWEPHTFSKDRGKYFDFDAMDEIEAMQSAAELAAQYYKRYVTPEVDAYRFGKMYTIKTSADANADLTADTIYNAIDAGTETMDDNEVPEEDRVLFLSNTCYKYLKDGSDINARVITGTESGVNRNVTYFDNMPIVKMPKSRFSTAPTYDNTGFAAGGYYINFAIVSKSAVIAILKHMKPKLIVPAAHQTKDAYRAAIRAYHDLFVPTNKVNGIYIHRKTTGI
jgi:hypothetical protein